jgi:hypothetical protein
VLEQCVKRLVIFLDLFIDFWIFLGGGRKGIYNPKKNLNFSFHQMAKIHYKNLWL